MTGSDEGALAVVAWAGWDDPSRALLRELSAGAARLEAAGASIHPLSMDEPQATAWARADIATTGLAEVGGRADTRTRELMDVLVGLTAGQYEELQLPLVYVFDRSGRLVSLHLGPDVEASAVLADLEAVGRQEVGRIPTALTGGRWLTLQPERGKLDTIANYLEGNGESALARSLRGDG